MDRPIVFPDEIPLDTDFLTACKSAMVGLGMALQAILGGSTVLDGLSCTPTSPASLTVLIGQGSIYSTENVDGSAYGSLGADTAHQIVKQGIVLGTTTLPATGTIGVPVTTGQSINYLVQVQYQDVDTGALVLPYYDASNPAVAYSGPSNLGTPQNNLRQGKVIIELKAGTAATTGSQVTPTPDAGFTGIWVITVANGQTTITSGNIALYPGAPFINYKLPQLSPAGAPPRTALSGNTTFYVSTTGSDSAAGTSGAPWQTIQHAVNYIQQSIDLAGYTATISVADGTYTAPVLVTSPFFNGTVQLTGDLATPSNCIISTTSASCISVANGACLLIGGFKLQTTTGGSGLSLGDCGQIEVNGAMVFGACADSHISCSYGSFLRLASNYTITGASPYHYFCDHSSDIQVNVGTTITVTGTPAFGNYFAQAYNCSVIELSSTTFTGSATGARFNVYQNACIDTGTANVNFLPGSSAGTAASATYGTYT